MPKNYQKITSNGVTQIFFTKTFQKKILEKTLRKKLSGKTFRKKLSGNKHARKNFPEKTFRKNFPVKLSDTFFLEKKNLESISKKIVRNFFLI